MHPKNIHNSPYNFEKLIKCVPALEKFVFINPYNTQTIDFSNPEAVLCLNKSLLAYYHDIEKWSIPKGYLCPSVPSRADYLCYVKDLLEKDGKTKNIKGLDIGTGANCIYPILAKQLFDWKMVGTDIDETAVQSAQKNIESKKELQENIEIRHQNSNANIFEGIIKENEYFDFTLCNPPFHSSKQEAEKAALQKTTNLKTNTTLNFGGQSNELWCNGGEALFIKRMIKQSVDFKKQVGWFTVLVSKKENLPKIYSLLEKKKAKHTTVDMEHGNKKTRFVAWKFLS